MKNKQDIDGLYWVENRMVVFDFQGQSYLKNRKDSAWMPPPSLSTNSPKWASANVPQNQIQTTLQMEFVWILLSM